MVCLLNLKHFAKLKLTSVNEILLSLSKLQMRFLPEAVSSELDFKGAITSRNVVLVNSIRGRRRSL